MGTVILTSFLASLNAFYTPSPPPLYLHPLSSVSLILSNYPSYPPSPIPIPLSFCFFSLFRPFFPLIPSPLLTHSFVLSTRPTFRKELFLSLFFPPENFPVPPSPGVLLFVVLFSPPVLKFLFFSPDGP